MEQLCVLCGVNPATKGKGDHLPPQAIYPKPRKPDVELHRVPACAVCNNTAGVEDEEFKVIMGLTTGEHTDAPDKVLNSLSRTIAFNKRFMRENLAHAKLVYIRQETEILQPKVAIKFNATNYKKVIARIVRGLFWRVTGQIMATDTDIRVYPNTETCAALNAHIAGVLSQTSWKELNGKTFAFKAEVMPDGDSYWQMSFFDAHTVFACTLAHPSNRPNAYRDREASSKSD